MLGGLPLPMLGGPPLPILGGLPLPMLGTEHLERERPCLMVTLQGSSMTGIMWRLR